MFCFEEDTDKSLIFSYISIFLIFCAVLQSWCNSDFKIKYVIFGRSWFKILLIRPLLKPLSSTASNLFLKIILGICQKKNYIRNWPIVL